MPIDPRTRGSLPPNPAVKGSDFQATMNDVFVALMDLGRRLSDLEGQRTVINDASITTGMVQTGAITTSSLAAGSVTAAQIQVGNVVASIMTVGAVNASHIDSASVRASVLDATVLTATNAYITSLRASILDAGVLTAASAQIGSLRAAIIDSTQIVTQGLQTQVLNAVNAAITSLASFNVTSGTITADLIRTAATGARIEIGNTAGGIKGYNSSGVMTFGFDTTTGTATVGAIAVTGANGTQVPASTLTGFVGGGNLLLDSSFESTDPATPASLWTDSGVVSTKSTTQSFHSTKALRVAYASGTDPYTSSELVVKHSIPITALRSRPLVFSAWVWVDTGAVTAAAGSPDRSLFITDSTGASATATSDSLTKGQWNRVVVKFTPAAGATSVTLRLYNRYTNAATYVYYDGVQVEFGDAATAYNPKADEIIYGSITSVEIAAGTIKTSNLEAGAVTADKISLGVPNTVSIANGQFSLGNPPDGSILGNGWTTFQAIGTSVYTVQSDSGFGRTARINNAASASGIFYQTQRLPVGRHVFRGWVKTTSVAGAGAGASLYVEFPGVGGASGTMTPPTPLTGTTGWTLQEVAINITATGLVQFDGLLGLGGGVTGTAEFANLHLVPSVTGTTLTPTAIDAMTITGALFQSTASNPAVRFDNTGFFVTDGTGTKTVNLTGSGGLVLAPASSLTPGVLQRIDWTTAGGTNVVQISGTLSPVSGGSVSTARALALGGAGGKDAYITATAPDSGAVAANPARVTAGAGGQAVTVINSDGVSSFLKIASFTSKVAVWGSSSVTFTASSTSAQATIAHSLGTTPVVVLCMAKNPQNGRVEFQETAAADATNIYITGFQTANTAVSITQNFYWLVIA